MSDFCSIMMTTEMKYFVLLFIISAAFGSEEKTDIDFDDETTTEEMIINENNVDFESEFLQHQQGYKMNIESGSQNKILFCETSRLSDYLSFLLAN